MHRIADYVYPWNIQGPPGLRQPQHPRSSLLFFSKPHGDWPWIAQVGEEQRRSEEKPESEMLTLARKLRGGFPSLPGRLRPSHRPSRAPSVGSSAIQTRPGLCLARRTKSLRRFILFQLRFFLFPNIPSTAFPPALAPEI